MRKNLASTYFEMELKAFFFVLGRFPMFTQKALCVCGFMFMTDAIAVLKKSGVFYI